MARMEQAHRFCGYCGRYTLHERPKGSSNVWQMILSVITLGLWLPLWALFALRRKLFVRYRCQACGKTN